MTEVYLITDGEYSDYNVCAVFSTEETAKLYQAQYGGRIETYILDPNIEELRKGLAIWTISMYRDGVVHNYYKDRLGIIGWELRNTLLRFTGSGDLDTVIKAANECRTQLIALGKWTEGGIK